MYIIQVDRCIFMPFQWRKKTSYLPKVASYGMGQKGCSKDEKYSNPLRNLTKHHPSFCMSNFGFMWTFYPFRFNKCFWTFWTSALTSPVLVVCLFPSQACWAWLVSVLELVSCHRWPRTASLARQDDRVHPCVMEVVASCAVKVVRRPSSVYFPPQEEGRTPQRLLQRSFLSLYLLCLGPVSTLRSRAQPGDLCHCLWWQLRLTGMEKGQLSFHEFGMLPGLGIRLWLSCCPCLQEVLCSGGCELLLGDGQAPEKKISSASRCSWFCTVVPCDAGDCHLQDM